MPTPAWMRYALYLAALYNLAWGAAVVLFPAWTFRVGGLYTPAHEPVDPALYRHLWRCIGMIVGVYGVGYAIAATDPVRHWPIVLVGLLGKLLGPIGAIDGVRRGELPASMLWTNVTNDFIWLVPFALILRHAYRASSGGAGEAPSG
jgi:small multidrug resistance pump